MSTYLELKEDIASWLDRDDLTSKVPTFVKLALNKINRLLKIFEMETIATTALSSDIYYELPPSFKSMRNIYISIDSINYKLTYVTPKQMILYSSNCSIPEAYTIVDGAIKLNKGYDGTGYLVMSYYKLYSMFEDDTDTNWLLENAYDLVLYGSLASAEGYVFEDERIGIWKTLFDEIVNELNESAEEARYSGDDLRSRSV